MSYAEVAVNSPGAHRRTFSYSIPPNMALSPGHAVWVPFGPQQLQGIVFEVTPLPAVADVREITALVHPTPLLAPYQIELARWIADYYLCSRFDAAALMLPPGFERKTLTYLCLSAKEMPPLTNLTPPQRQVLALLERRNEVEQQELEKALGAQPATTVVGQLLRRGLVARRFELARPRVGPKLVSYLRLTMSPEDALREAALLAERGRAPRQGKLLEVLTAAPGPMPRSEAQDRAGCSPQAVAALVKRGFIAIEEIRVERDPLAQHSFPTATPPPLTPDQEAAWLRIEAAIHESERGNLSTTFLLHGVTGSGKTELYLRALTETLRQGKRGIMLVPEIALTPQTIERFAARFPGQVAVLHSRLSPGEQFDEWWRIQEGHFSVVIGSRGAIFAPQPDLGLIVLDEEHEWTYKQEQPPPRYHAREVALQLAELTGAVMILGSATPDITSYYRAQRGRFHLLALPERIGSSPVAAKRLPSTAMPQVQIVDMRQELKQGNRSIFSRPLVQAMKKALSSGEQVILFMNRRGAASFVQCRDCGAVLRCRRCDVSLTYHSASEDLVCHLCNDRTSIPSMCPECFGHRIRFFGLGTQKIENEVAQIFPQARLLRWDRDTTTGRHSHDVILRRFLAHEADVLIGTQMIAKGLDMPLVTLVGVVSADTSLNLPDFRSAERTFQLLTQVAGRAGRGPKGGQAIIQTYTPEHYAIVAASHHDYAAFYDKELPFRHRQGYPPYSPLVRLLYTHVNEEQCQRETLRVRHLLQEAIDAQSLVDTHLVGPVPAYISRVRGRYRWQIILRGQSLKALLEEQSLPRGWAIDVDPVHLL